MPEKDEKSQAWQEVVRLVRSRQPTGGQQLYYVVRFHADGGNGPCVPGRRTFVNCETALQFAESCRHEPGHLCGADTVTVEVSATNPGNEGMTACEMALFEEVAEERRRVERERRAQEPWWRRLLYWLEMNF